MIDCIHCGVTNSLPSPNDLSNKITVKCSGCGQRTPTGLEDQFRPKWENCIPRKFPKVTALHALGLSNAIYKTAEDDGTNIWMARDISRRRTLRKVGYCSIREFRLIRGRSHRGLTDNSVVAAVVVMDNHGTAPERTVYVVFRGSNDASRVDHDGSTANIDWRANMNTRMQQIGSWGGPVMVHSGFSTILGSYMDRMVSIMNDMLTQHGLYGNVNVVVTGHSQGAAHAILFSYLLRQSHPHINPFCIVFSPPRVGNLAFARHFSEMVTHRPNVLPHDGPTEMGAYLMVKGRDPVVFGGEHAFRASRAERNRMADRGMYHAGPWAQDREENHSVAEEVYFHPKGLTQIDGMALPGLGQTIHHHPGLFLKKLIEGF